MTKDTIVLLIVGSMVITLIGHLLVYKYIVLKRLKEFHTDIWVNLGSPGILSVKESLWALMRLPKDEEVRKEMLGNEIGAETHKQLQTYRKLSIAWIVFWFLCMGALIWVERNV